MQRNVVVALATAIAVVATLGLGAARAGAKVPWDRVNITCATGEAATWGARERNTGARVLGCVELADGRRLQLSAHRSADLGEDTCFFLTYATPRHGASACKRVRPGEVRILLLARFRSTLPVLAVGFASPQADAIVVRYTGGEGAPAEAAAQSRSIDRALGERVGASGGFVAFVAELEADADVCRGVASDPVAHDGRSLGSARVVPERGEGLRLAHGGWVKGFAPTYGWGTSGRAASVCRRPPADAVSRLPAESRSPLAVDLLESLARILSGLL